MKSKVVEPVEEVPKGIATIEKLREVEKEKVGAT
jgi:hypothetical protein